jgi:hypothetical protein
MPDRENWTTAMVLKWVLNRDGKAVLDMVDTYGAVGVLEDGTVSLLVPEDIEAVGIAYCTDPAFFPGEERTVAAVVRSQRVIAAKAEIYRALRRGELEVRARRNGVGDIEKIPPEQWLSLKLVSWNGHDLAVPIDIEKNTLHPLPTADYLTGSVPIDTRPLVWPDPLFSARQVVHIWPPAEGREASRAFELLPDATERVDQPVLESPRKPFERPEGVSNKDWETYVLSLKKGYDLDRRGNITEAAKSIAADRGHSGQYNTERRVITRVRKAFHKIDRSQLSKSEQNL